MAGPVDGVQGIGVADSKYGAPSGVARDIPENKETYGQSDDAGQVAGDQEIPDEFTEALVSAGAQFVGTMAFGMLQKGLSDSKKMQEEAYSKLREADNDG